MVPNPELGRDAVQGNIGEMGEWMLSRPWVVLGDMGS